MKGGGEGLALSHLSSHAYRMTRAEFDKMRLLAPLFNGSADEVERVARESFNVLGSGPSRKKARSLHAADKYWPLHALTALLVMVTGFEPGGMRRALLALHAKDALIATRGVWLAVNQPAALMAFVWDAVGINAKKLRNVLVPLLSLVALRFPAYRAEAREVAAALEAKAREADPNLEPVEVLTDEARAVQQGSVYLLHNLVRPLWPAWPAEFRARVLDDAWWDTARQRVMTGEGTPLERAERLDPAVADAWCALDPWRDLHHQPSPHLRPLDRLSDEERRRIGLWRVMLFCREKPTRLEPLEWILLTTLAPQEALVPDEEPDPLWRMAAGRTYIDERLPKLVAQFRDHTPVKNETASVGPNAPCPCGSGKKFKKCCSR